MHNITIVDVKNANAITHYGCFHADEVFSTVLLSRVLPQVNLARVTKVPEKLSKKVIVYDIGGGKYDHHQRNFAEARKNGIKYSSFGLLWKEFGWKYLYGIENDEYVFELFDSYLVQGIDAADNGQMCDLSIVRAMTISGIISLFNPEWNEVSSSNHRFMKAVEHAEIIFDKSLRHCMAVAKAKATVDSAIANSQNGIMILEKSMPWQEFVFNSDNVQAKRILYVIFPSNRNGYNVQAVPNQLGCFDQRKPLPESWAGLRDSELANVCQVPDAIFCHPARFICGAKNLEAALKMAEKAIRA